MADALKADQESFGLRAVTMLPGRGEDADRQADRVNGRMQLGRQADTGATDRGSFSPPFAPVASACTFEMVLSILDSLSLWTDLGLPLAPPLERPPAATGMPVHQARDRPLVSAALLSHALARLSADADGFLSGFASFLRGPGAGMDDRDAARAFVARSMMAAERFRAGHDSGAGPTR